MGPVADRIVVLAVVTALGAIGVLGTLGIVFLIWTGAPADTLTPVVALVGPATGALAALLASTRTATPALAQAEATGFSKAVEAVHALDPGPQPTPPPSEPVLDPTGTTFVTPEGAVP